LVVLMHSFGLLLSSASNSARTGRGRSVRRGCLLADLAAHEAVRITQLFTKHLADEQSRDRAESDRQTARAACVAARASVNESGSRIVVAKVGVFIDGVGGEVNAEVGEVVIPSPLGTPTPPAIDLIEEGCLYVSAPIDDVNLRPIGRMLAARQRLDADEDLPPSPHTTPLAVLVSLHLFP